jgi:hypothetical protein
MKEMASHPCLFKGSEASEGLSGGEGGEPWLGSGVCSGGGQSMVRARTGPPERRFYATILAWLIKGGLC